jgi:hypothetical protein
MDLTELTAQFMSNKKFIDKLNVNDKNNTYQIFMKESNFYEERIMELTDSLLKNREQIEPHLTKEVLTAFNTYVRSCICFFKTKDMNDIHQQEHQLTSRFSIKEEKTEQELEKDALHELENLCSGEDIPFQFADKIMMRQIKITNNLDKFLKYNKKDSSIIFPKQKDVDLEHPDLKKKPFFTNIVDPPPLTPYPITSKSAIEEIKNISKSLVEELILEVIEKIENNNNKKYSNKKKKKHSKKVETMHIDL